MAMPTVAEAVAKHNRNLKNSVQSIKEGVARVQESPTVTAANNIEKMRNNLMAAFDDGSVERGLRAYTLAEWKAAMLTKGVNNIGTGIDNAAQKMADFFGQLFPYQASLSARIQAMPDLTLEDSRSRMNAQFDGMAAFSYK